MATNTYVIKWLKDKLTGTRFFPITHIKAVRDDNNANLETLLGEKQDELVSGTNIKTVNNNSLVGSGNVTIPVPAKTSELINDSGFLTTGDIPEGAAASTTTPKMDGTASVGTEMAFARGDHRHPKDTSKQDVISDLAEIRAGAALGATALQSFTESDPTVPSWAKAESKPTYTASEVGAVPTARKVNGKALSADITLSASDVGALPSSTAIPDELADLSDDSTHRLVTDAEKSTWNGKGTYSKPSGGIPKTDLANAVQTSLGKADTALQSESDPVFSASAAADITSSDISNWNGKTSNVGTITGITMNGASKGTSGVVDLGTVITAHQDISGKVDKNGTGATGTWEISITGNASTATVGERNTYIFNSQQHGSNKTATVNDLAISCDSAVGMILSSTDNPAGTNQWVHVWSQSWIDGSPNWTSQIAVALSTGGTGTGLYYRSSNNEDSIVGKEWRKVLDSNNYTSYLSNYLTISDAKPQLTAITSGTPDVPVLDSNELKYMTLTNFANIIGDKTFRTGGGSSSGALVSTFNKSGVWSIGNGTTRGFPEDNGVLAVFCAGSASSNVRFYLFYGLTSGDLYYASVWGGSTLQKGWTKLN